MASSVVQHTYIHVHSTHSLPSPKVVRLLSRICHRCDMYCTQTRPMEQIDLACVLVCRSPVRRAFFILRPISGIIDGVFCSGEIKSTGALIQRHVISISTSLFNMRVHYGLWPPMTICAALVSPFNPCRWRLCDGWMPSSSVALINRPGAGSVLASTVSIKWRRCGQDCRTGSSWRTRQVMDQTHLVNCTCDYLFGS